MLGFQNYDSIPPPFSSRIKKVCISLATVACLWSIKEMRQLKEGQVEERKWFLCRSGPRVPSYLAFLNQNG